MAEPDKGPVPLKTIKQTLTTKALDAGILNPLRTFFHEMELQWSDTPTARATMIGGKPVIEIGRKFFAENVRNFGESADVVLHELMHHMFVHLPLMENLIKSGCSYSMVDLSMDALINAYLHKVGCAGFMERFYSDEGAAAFLRPNSTKFSLPKRFLFWTRLKPARRVDVNKWREFTSFYDRLYKLQVTLDEALEFFGKHFPDQAIKQPLLGNHRQAEGSSGQGGGQSSPPPQQASGGKAGKKNKPGCGDKSDPKDKGGQGNKPDPKDKAGQDNKPDPKDKGGQSNKPDPKDKAGDGRADECSDHGSPPEQLPPDCDDGTPGDAGDAEDGQCGSRGGGYDSPRDDWLLSPLEIAALKSVFTARDVMKKCRSNFERIIGKIAACTKKPGDVRAELRLSRRLPARLCRRDLLNIERGKDLFTNSDYRLREVWIFPDVSSSLSAYLPFIAGLIGSLQRLAVKVHIVCWADGIAEVPLADVAAGRLPGRLGTGTCGEVVARFIAERRIEQAVIITDNAAGDIATPIRASLQLCLVEGASEQGSFIKPGVARCLKVHKLRLKDDSET